MAGAGKTHDFSCRVSCPRLLLPLSQPSTCTADVACPRRRAVLSIIDGKIPSEQAVRENAYGLARYAATCQENGLVPIVEPEIMMDGAHDIDVAQAAAECVWSACYKALADQHVFLEGTMLKPAMVIPGQDCKGTNNNANAIALATVTALRRAVPAAVPGICVSPPSTPLAADSNAHTQLNL